MKRGVTILISVNILVFTYLGNEFAADKLPVFVSIVPQKYFVQQIGKDLVDVQAMVQPGASPATYEPKPQQMADLSKTKIYFAIGVPFENAWLEKIAGANPNMRVVHTDHGIEKIAMAAHHHHNDHEEKHHGKGEHPSAAKRREAMVALEHMEMEAHADKKIGMPSGRQRQRVFIARALVARPKLLLLDEPPAATNYRGSGLAHSQERSYSNLEVLRGPTV